MLNPEHKQMLDALALPMPFKYRSQSATQYGANLVAYVDSRQVAARLDEVFGLNWSDHYEVRNGSTFCRISVQFPDGRTMYREDLGTESATESEKGEVSDAFKRAAVKFGVGRFLYDMGILRTDALENGKNKAGKPIFVPCVDKTDSYSKLTNPDDLNAFATMLIASGGDMTEARKEWAKYKKSGGSKNAANKAKYRYLAVETMTSKIEAEKPVDLSALKNEAQRHMTSIKQNDGDPDELSKLVAALVPGGIESADGDALKKLNGYLNRFRIALVTRKMMQEFDSQADGGMRILATARAEVKRVYNIDEIPVKIYSAHPCVKADLSEMTAIMQSLDV